MSPDRFQLAWMDLVHGAWWTLAVGWPVSAIERVLAALERKAS